MGRLRARCADVCTGYSPMLASRWTCGEGNTSHPPQSARGEDKGVQGSGGQGRDQCWTEPCLSIKPAVQPHPSRDSPGGPGTVTSLFRFSNSSFLKWGTL